MKKIQQVGQNVSWGHWLVSSGIAVSSGKVLSIDRH